MKHSRKNGFTLVELITALVVLSLAGLTISVCVSTAWALKSQADTWQQNTADLARQLALTKGEQTTLTLNGPVSLHASGENAFRYQLEGLYGVYAFFPNTVDQTDLSQSGVAAPALPGEDAADPLLLAAPAEKAAQSVTFTANGNTGAQGASLYAGDMVLQTGVSLVVLRQEFLYLTGDISAVRVQGQPQANLTAAPASGNAQPLLVYLPRTVTLTRIVNQQHDTDAVQWQAGWYEVPAGADLLAADEAQLGRWALSPLRYGAADAQQLSAAQQEELALALDAAFARLTLLGVW